MARLTNEQILELRRIALDKTQDVLQSLQAAVIALDGVLEREENERSNGA